MSKSPYSPRAALGFFCWSLGCQIVGFAGGQVFLRIVAFISDSLFLSNSLLVLFGLLIAHSLTAYVAASWIRLPSAWKIFNLLITPSIVIYETFALPPSVLIIAVVISVLIYLPTFWTRVPYYPTSLLTYEEIAALVAENKAGNFLDIGCGFGKLLSFLSGKFKEAKFEGVEIGPLPFLVSKFRSFLRRNMHIKAKSFWKISLSPYQIVYAFLAPGPMEKLWEKAKTEMKPGSIFISNTFQAPLKADQEIEIADKKRSTLYIYKIT